MTPEQISADIVFVTALITTMSKCEFDIHLTLFMVTSLSFLFMMVFKLILLCFRIHVIDNDRIVCTHIAFMVSVAMFSFGLERKTTENMSLYRIYPILSIAHVLLKRG